MCTKAEVRDVVSTEIAPLKVEFDHVATTITEIKDAIKELPCSSLKEDMIAMKLKLETWKEEKENIFRRLRAAEDSGSIKIKHIITVVMSGIVSAALAVMVYKYTRGV